MKIVEKRAYVNNRKRIREHTNILVFAYDYYSSVVLLDGARTAATASSYSAVYVPRRNATAAVRHAVYDNDEHVRREISECRTPKMFAFRLLFV